MPKLPRGVSHARLVRFLRREGFHVARQGSKHTIMARGDVFVAVPRHTKLKVGTVHSILKEANIPRARWADL